MKNQKVDLIYRNTGRAAAHKIQQTALNISRSNAKDAGPWNASLLMSPEGAALAKKSATCNAFEVPYSDDPRQRFAVSDTETESWRKFKPGDDPASIVSGSVTALIAEQSDEEEEPEEFDEEHEEEDDLLDPETVKTGNAFDRARLFRAIDRLTKRTKRRVASRDGRSYAQDDGRSYTTCTGCVGGADEWNELFRRGEVC
jgi:hypothetical protein